MTTSTTSSVPLPPQPALAPAPVSTTPQPAAQRFRGRIRGIDLARGLAILGMIWAHVKPIIYEPGTVSYILSEIPSGRSSALFAFLAGISLAILSGRNVTYTGEQLRHAQLRIVGRAVILLAFAAFLSIFPTVIAVILGFYAAWFILAVPFLHWSPKKLGIAAGVVALIGPQIINGFHYLSYTFDIFLSGGVNAYLYEVLLTGMYPGLAYMAYVFAGMAIGRLDLNSTAVRLRMLTAGLAISVVGYGSGYLAAIFMPFEPLPIDDIDAFSLLPKEPTIDPWDFFSIEPHTNTTPEVLGNLGFALIVLALCLWLTPLAKNVFFPIAAVGSMSLTAYVGHAFGLYFKEDWFMSMSPTPFLIVAGTVLAFCTVWALLPLRRGPLEWVTYIFSQWFARPTLPRP
ncbi:heparan-alpha-glucosaminide N-acetyltransferase domain-containing protein [Trueperella pyogenes]|uniref:heparan-alpha-glucosaminide N-acetyltransferase domain-containing protein n=1 Tax=Trueperella pyogenes TaxID=1661 RepID=UPI00345CE756